MMRSHKRLLITMACFMMLLFIIQASGCAREEPRLDPIYATVEIQIPCTDPLHIQPSQEPAAEGPFLMADPQCGTMAGADGTSGTEIVLHGSSYYPHTETTLIWEDNLGNEFRYRQAGEEIKPITDQEGEFFISILIPHRFLPPSIEEDILVWKLTALQGEPAGEVEPILWGLLFEHLYVSGAGAIMGIGAGIFAGHLLAKALHRLLQSKPYLRTAGFFIPSRTILISLLMMFLIYPVLLIIKFGYGAIAGIIGTSVTTLIFATSFSSTLFLWKWQSASLTFQIASAIRTLMVLSVFITTWLGNFPMGGVTWIAVMHVRLYEYDVGLRYFLMIIAILFVLDLLGGSVAFLLDRRERDPRATSEPDRQ